MAVVRGRVPAVDTIFQLLYSRASSPGHCRVLSWNGKEPVMTTATTSLWPLAFLLTMTRLPVPPRFHLRPQLLSHRERLLTEAPLATISCDLKGA